MLGRYLKKLKRKSLPVTIEVEVLTQSARRCALCFGIDKDFSEKKGQIAHLDKDRNNNRISNLAFLCLFHHDGYDTVSSQSKGYRIAEVKKYRADLYLRVGEKFSRQENFERESLEIEERIDKVSEVSLKYNQTSLTILEQQIISRVTAIDAFLKAVLELQSSDYWTNTPEDFFNEQVDRIRNHLEIPKGIWGLTEIGIISEDWIEEVTYLVRSWVNGIAHYDDCSELIWQLEERYDFDLHWILYGISYSELEGHAYELLEHFIYVFGLRRQTEKDNKAQ